MFSALPLKADIEQRGRYVRFVPIGDVTPVYSITPSTVASNLDGSFRPNVLAVLSRRFSLSVPFWLPWTIVHFQRGGADDEDDFGTNPKYPILTLPKSEHETTAWEVAIEALLIAA